MIIGFVKVKFQRRHYWNIDLKINLFQEEPIKIGFLSERKFYSICVREKNTVDTQNDRVCNLAPNKPKKENKRN